jgi:hypothetical protein
VRRFHLNLHKSVFLIGYGAVAGFNVGDEKPPHVMVPYGRYGTGTLRMVVPGSTVPPVPVPYLPSTNSPHDQAEKCP